MISLYLYSKDPLMQVKGFSSNEGSSECRLIEFLLRASFILSSAVVFGSFLFKELLSLHRRSRLIFGCL